MFLRNIIFFLLIIFITVRCKKENENSLPTNTEIGANTLIFRVNGGDIINSQVGYLPSMPRIKVFYNHKDTYSNHDFLFKLSGGKVFLDINKYIYIDIESLTTVGIYTLSEGNYCANYHDYSKPNDLSFYTDKEHTGTLEIHKLDTVNHIIAGRFKFDALQYILYDVHTEEHVFVEGQFDVKYKPNNEAYYY